MEKVDDRRVRMTKRMLSEALLTLLKEKPISKITATELCRLADINRNTFYAHYSVPEDLFEEIENEIFKKLERSIVASVKNGDIGTLLDEICKAIKDNAILCTIILSNNTPNNLLSRLIAVAHDKTINEWHQLGRNIDNNELESFFLFATGGSMAVIRNWVDNGLKEDPKVIASLIKKINSYIPLALIKKK